MALSLSFQFRKRSPDVPRDQALLSVHADDKAVTLQADKRCRLPVQKFGQQNPGRRHYLASNSRFDGRTGRTSGIADIQYARFAPPPAFGWIVETSCEFGSEAHTDFFSTCSFPFTSTITWDAS